jgi:copper(I)-binding protein
MMAMHPIERIDIPAGGSAKLEPGGYHLMLMGVTKMPAVGETVELTLTFEKAGDVVVQAEVRAG